MSFVQARARARHDIYALIHKALRLSLTRLLTRLGSADAADGEAMAALMAEVRAQLSMSEMHLAKEDLYIHPALEERAPGAVAGLERDHDHHRRSFEELAALAGEVEAESRGPALRRLYLRFSLFVADDFAHMAEEEQLINPVLQSLFSDEELVALETRIRAAIPPQQMFQVAQAMIPAATRAERIQLMAGVQAAAPAEAFQGLLFGAARPNLSDDDFAHLCDALGVAA